MINSGSNDQLLEQTMVAGTVVAAKALMDKDVADKFFVGAAFLRPGSPTEMQRELVSAMRDDPNLRQNIAKVGVLNTQGHTPDDQTLRDIAGALQKRQSSTAASDPTPKATLNKLPRGEINNLR